MAKKVTVFEKRAKLLVCIVGKEKETALTEACNSVCVSLHFSAIGYGTARSNYLSYFGLDEIEKRVVYSLIPNYCESKVLRAINKRLRLYLPGNGIAFTVPISGISSIISNAILSTPQKEDSAEMQKSQAKEKENTQMHELVIAVVNQKYTDRVLDAARAAGATGATLLHTRSVNNKQIEQIVGTNIREETDTLAFLVSHEYKVQIMQAIQETAGLKTEGGAILFSLPVDTLVGIGRFDDDED